ncbi:MAG: c-type cytochrome biogenesis protein CcsB [Candidatus Nanopelagicales bacterium]|nr:c-type cytochrome biogenesis protein CcsB [Candidatus Nanopelagicales bacterium]MDZ4250123.1 c-type cytochrome biogenesis protein CcsB [Candidatus Nanopelagicales bacterium]
MLKLSEFCVLASLFMALVALVLYVVALATAGTTAQRERVAVGAGSRGSGGVPPSRSGEQRSRRGLAYYGTALVRLALVLLTAALLFLTLVTGHGPFSNQYEFSVAFAWGIIAVYVYFEYRYRVRTLALLVLPVASALLLYAMTLGASTAPLVPALQNNLLLTVHVALAIVAYGAFAVAGGAAVLYLIQPRFGGGRLPKPALLEEIGYRAILIGFPLLTMVVLLGAVWAEVAWGTYWGWDPKETASLVTWLIYGAYLHARVVRGWRGRRAAWLLLLGFGAVLLTFFGNLFFGGLHAYA